MLVYLTTAYEGNPVVAINPNHVVSVFQDRDSSNTIISTTTGHWMIKNDCLEVVGLLNSCR